MTKPELQAPQTKIFYSPMILLLREGDAQLSHNEWSMTPKPFSGVLT